jgi:hypothetical protein
MIKIMHAHNNCPDECFTWSEGQGAYHRVGHGLDYHPNKPDVVEYLAYEEAKKDVLQSNIGQAALLQGRIVWRLAQDAVKMKAMTRGPLVLSKMQGCMVGTLDGAVLVDNILEDADEDVIYGVYHVYTSMDSFTRF